LNNVGDPNPLDSKGARHEWALKKRRRRRRFEKRWRSEAARFRRCAARMGIEKAAPWAPHSKVFAESRGNADELALWSAAPEAPL
jgi:hypothetical protein